MWQETLTDDLHAGRGRYFVIKGILYHENVLSGTKALCRYVLFRLNVLFRTKLQNILREVD